MDRQTRELLRRISNLEDQQRKAKNTRLANSSIVDGGIIVGDPDGSSSRLIIRGDSAGGVIEFYGPDGQPGYINPAEAKIEITSPLSQVAVDAGYTQAYVYVAGQQSTLHGPEVHILSPTSERYGDGSVGGDVNVNGELRVRQRLFAETRDRHYRVRDTDWTIGSDTTWRTIAWNGVIENTTEDPNEEIVYDTGGFFIFAARCYLVTASITFTGSSTTGKRGLRLWGTADLPGSFGGGTLAELFVDASSAGQTSLSVTALVESLDIVEAQFFQDSGSNVDILTGSRMNVRRLF